MNINNIIEYDLNAGELHKICSNETTFKHYVNYVFKRYLQSEIERLTKLDNSYIDTCSNEHTEAGYHWALQDNIIHLENLIKEIK